MRNSKRINKKKEIESPFSDTFSAASGDQDISVNGNTMQKKELSNTPAEKPHKRRTRTVLVFVASIISIILLFLVINPLQITVTLHGQRDLKIEYGSVFDDPGASARFGGKYFFKKLALPAVHESGKVKTDKLGDYKLEYKSRFAFFQGRANRVVHVVDTTKPVLTLKGETKIEVYAGAPFEEPGFTAQDLADGDITSAVKVKGTVDTEKAGTYTLTYTVRDKSGNESTTTRTVTVKKAVQPAVIKPGSKVIYLTFDDGPGASTARLLDILHEHNVKATFFVTGAGDSSLIGREAREGHTVGVHTKSHDYSEIYASEEAYLADFRAMNEIIRTQTGAESKLFRFPGGSSNTVSSFNPGIMTRLTALLPAMGYIYFDWNVSSGDAGGTTSTKQVAENIISGIQGHDVSVVLQHDSKDFSVDAVEQVINWGMRNGYVFLPLTKSSPRAHHQVNN